MHMNKKIAAWLAVLLCASLTIFAQLPTSLAGSYDIGVVNNPNPQDRLNLREEPNTGSVSYGKYYNGVEVQIRQYWNSEWAQVQIGTAVGFMQTKFLAINPVPGSIRSMIPTATVNNPNPSDRLNLRESNSEQAASLGKYYNGTQVEVLGYGEAWHHVRVDGRIGFMMGRYLRMSAGSGAGGTGGIPTPGARNAIVNNPNPADRLNLRGSITPSGQGGPSIAKYFNGVDVEIQSYVANMPDWVFVRIGTAYGYMQVRYLAVGVPANSVRSAIPVLTVNNPNPQDRLNLRAAASNTAPSLGKYYNGTRVEVLGIMMDNRWYHVRVDGRTGYMMANYLR